MRLQSPVVWGYWGSEEMAEAPSHTPLPCAERATVCYCHQSLEDRETLSLEENWSLEEGPAECGPQDWMTQWLSLAEDTSMMAGDRVRIRALVLPRKPAEEYSMETRQFSPETTKLHSLLSQPKCPLATQKKGIKEILKTMHAPKRA